MTSFLSSVFSGIPHSAWQVDLRSTRGFARGHPQRNIVLWKILRRLHAKSLTSYDAERPIRFTRTLASSIKALRPKQALTRSMKGISPWALPWTWPQRVLGVVSERLAEPRWNWRQRLIPCYGGFGRPQNQGHFAVAQVIVTWLSEVRSTVNAAESKSAQLWYDSSTFKF